MLARGIAGGRIQVPASACGAQGRRILIFCAGALLLATMAYVAATFGFQTVVRCELESNGALGQSGSAISQIALSNACGF